MSHEEYSNIITPPDFVVSRSHSVVVIDPEWTEIEDLALFLKTASEPFNVYVYRAEMNDQAWLEEAISKSLGVIVNTVNNDIAHYKDQLVGTNTESFYYGPKNFLMNKHRIEKPIDYFVEYFQ